MNGRPAENGRNGALLSVDENPHAWGYLMVDTAIAFEIDQPLRVDIVDEPADLVGMRLDHNLERRLRVDDTHRRAICIGEMRVHIRLQVVEPELLPAALEANRGR